MLLASGRAQRYLPRLALKAGFQGLRGQGGHFKVGEQLKRERMIRQVLKQIYMSQEEC